MSSLAAAWKTIGARITPADDTAKIVRNSQKASENWQQTQEYMVVGSMKF